MNNINNFINRKNSCVEYNFDQMKFRKKVVIFISRNGFLDLDPDQNETDPLH